jgi:hypothetical protein
MKDIEGPRPDGQLLGYGSEVGATAEERFPAKIAFSRCGTDCMICFLMLS